MLVHILIFNPEKIDMNDLKSPTWRRNKIELLFNRIPVIFLLPTCAHSLIYFVTDSLKSNDLTRITFVDTTIVGFILIVTANNFLLFEIIFNVKMFNFCEDKIVKFSKLLWIIGMIEYNSEGGMINIPVLTLRLTNSFIVFTTSSSRLGFDIWTLVRVWLSNVYNIWFGLLRQFFDGTYLEGHLLLALLIWDFQH